MKLGLMTHRLHPYSYRINIFSIHVIPTPFSSCWTSGEEKPTNIKKNSKASEENGEERQGTKSTVLIVLPHMRAPLFAFHPGSATLEQAQEQKNNEKNGQKHRFSV